MKKQFLRGKIKEKRERIDITIKNNFDKIIKEKFLTSKYFETSKLIFIYVNMDSEINTLNIITESLNSGKRVAVPKVMPGKREMKALEINSLLDLNESGAFGILEPNISNKDVSDEVDLIILPGLAFDEQGNRIGYGGGFYDKFLERYSDLKKIALCYDFQIIKEIPREDFDHRVDVIITENRILETNVENKKKIK